MSHHRSPSDEPSVPCEPLLPAQCICCGAKRWREKYEILQECAACGFVRADLEIDPVELEQLYAESYFQGNEYADYLADQAVHEKNFRYRVQQILAKQTRPRAIFEVGCAYGFFLQACRQANLVARGIDVSPAPVEYARQQQLNAEHGDFLQLPLGSGDYDCYCLWDVIEHLPRPELFIQRIHHLLPPGGSLLVTTGDIESRNARRRGRHWRMIHPPTHLQYFGRSTIERFLQHSGFEAIEIESVPMYRNLHSVLSGLAVFHHGWLGRLAGGLHRLIPTACQKWIGGWLDLGDIMLVRARKGLDHPEPPTKAV